jgi:two-component system LytT family sensor kinase
LTDFAEFTRHLFRDGRSYVTLGEEVDHVERYLRLEQARFRDLNVTIEVPDDARATVVPAMSLQPLVENAVRHGIERRAGSGRVAITASLIDGDIVLRITDDGVGIAPERVSEVLAGAGGGIGVSNVDSRLRATFGERYALRIESELGAGTTTVMTVPHLRGEIANHDLADSPDLAWLV